MAGADPGTETETDPVAEAGTEGDGMVHAVTRVREGFARYRFDVAIFFRNF